MISFCSGLHALIVVFLWCCIIDVSVQNSAALRPHSAASKMIWFI
jgi:hypothetical protein